MRKNVRCEVLILFLIIFFNHAFAQKINNKLKRAAINATDVLLQAPDKPVDVNIKYEDCSTDCSDELSNTDVMSAARACVEKICGPAKELVGYQDMIRAANDAPTEPIDRLKIAKVKRNLAQIFDLQEQGLRSVFDNYEIVLKDGSFKLTDESANALFISSSINLLINVLTNPMQDPPVINVKSSGTGEMEISIKKDALRKLLKRIYGKKLVIRNFLERLAFSEEFKIRLLVHLGTSVPSLLPMIEKNPDKSKQNDDSLNDEYDWQTIYKKKVERLPGMLQKIKKRYPEVMELEGISDNMEILTSIGRGSLVKRNAKILENIGTMATFDIYLNNNFKKGFIGHQEIANNNFKRDLNNLKFKRIKKLLGDSATINKIKKRAINQCISSIEFDLNALPTQKMIIDFERRYIMLKDRVKKNILHKLSDKSSNVISKELNRTPLLPPISREDFLSDLVESYNPNKWRQKRDASKAGISSSAAQIQMINSLKFFNNMGNFYAFEKQIHPLEVEFVRSCKQKAKSMIDQVLRTKRISLYVSWNSIKSNKFGNSVISHEIGHAMSFLLSARKVSIRSKQKYEKTRQCLEENHPDASTKKSLYTEEDWADFISGSIDPDTNSGCFLMDKDEHKEYRAKLLDATWTAASGKKNFESEEHSTPFYRTMSIHLLTGKTLPYECKQYYKMKGYSRILQKECKLQ